MSTPERPKIVISFDDEADPPVAAAPPAAAASQPETPPPLQYPPPAAAPAGEQVFPTVAGVGRAPTQVGGFGPPRPLSASGAAGLNLGSVRTRNLVAATVGILVGWLLTEVFGIAGWPAETKAGANLHAAIFVSVLGFCFAVIYVGWEHIESANVEGVLESAKRVGPVGAGLGLVAGFLASVIFLAMLEQAFESGSQGVLYLARILGWGIFGLGMGVATAAIVQSREKLITGAIGGVAGGAAGGLVFQFVGERVHSDTFSRLIGLLVIGAGIGLAIGLVETLRRQAWFNIVGGGMTGKEFVLYENETKVGSSPKCEITLIKDSGIQPFHFIITTAPNGVRRTITAYQGCAVTINGTPIAQHELRNGDRIGVGATTIAYAERAL